MAQTPKPPDLSCRDVELTCGDSGCKCVHYRRLDPNGDYGRRSVSEHSPGKVEHTEVLCRLILPEHLRGDLSTINPFAFRAVETLGLSVIRARHVSRAGMRERALAYARRKDVPLADVSLAVARCGDVRTIALSGVRGYRVYDTATEHDPAHADVCRALMFPPGTPDQRLRFGELREKLTEIFAVVRGAFD